MRIASCDAARAGGESSACLPRLPPIWSRATRRAAGTDHYVHVAAVLLCIASALLRRHPSGRRSAAAHSASRHARERLVRRGRRPAAGLRPSGRLGSGGAKSGWEYVPTGSQASKDGLARGHTLLARDKKWSKNAERTECPPPRSRSFVAKRKLGGRPLRAAPGPVMRKKKCLKLNR